MHGAALYCILCVVCVRGGSLNDWTILRSTIGIAFAFATTKSCCRVEKKSFTPEIKLPLAMPWRSAAHECHPLTHTRAHTHIYLFNFNSILFFCRSKDVRFSDWLYDIRRNWKTITKLCAYRKRRVTHTSTSVHRISLSLGIQYAPHGNPTHKKGKWSCSILNSHLACFSFTSVVSMFIYVMSF